MVGRRNSQTGPWNAASFRRRDQARGYKTIELSRRKSQSADFGYRATRVQHLSENMSELLLDAQQVEFVSQTGKMLLQPVSLQLSAGERVALMGASGSGKSLLLRALAVLNAHQKGEVRFLGKCVTTDIPQFRARCIYVPQKIDIGSRTVEEFLNEPFRLATHTDRQFDAKRISDWLSTLHRDETLLRQQTANLSGGERQIVTLLRALQLDPLVMLLDEPTAALDHETTLLVESLLSKWMSDTAIENGGQVRKGQGRGVLQEKHVGRALIWVSHDAEQVRRIGTKHWKMEDGVLNT